MPYPINPLDKSDPNYDAKLDPHSPQYDANDPRLVFADPGGHGDPTLGRPSSTTGQMTAKEADQYRASLRRGDSGGDLSTKDADQYLKQYRAQQGTSKVAPNQVAGETAAPPITGDQAAAPPEDFFHSAYHALPDIVQKHPIIAGLGAAAAIPLAGALIPEGAIGALAGYGLRNIITPGIKAAAGTAGLGAAADLFSGGKLHETLMPKLIEMISHLGEEGQ